MKLTTITQITADGVMQGNGHATDEERRDGFTRDGWAMGRFADETSAWVEDFSQRADAYLFGRKTYDIFAAYWGAPELVRAVAKDPDHDRIAHAFNSRPKYVASNTLTDPGWADTTVLSGDLEAAVRELKARPGGEIQVHGSGALTRWLLAKELVDELVLLVFPVILGQGTRLFPESGPDIELELVDSRADSKGVTTQTYRPAGRPTYAPNRPAEDA